MRKSMKMVCAMVIGSIVLFSACNKDDDIGAKENKESISKSATESVDMTTSNYIGTEDVQETTEDDYMIADAPGFEADKNVESGIEIDSTLASAIRRELGYGANEVLTYSDLERVTYLATWDDVITSIKGISFLTNLEEIHIGSNYISDISEMATLKHIKCIDVSNGYIKEISDFSKCGNLESLYLSGNMIEDVSPIANIPNIKFVDLNCNLIKSIEPLKDAKNLETLCIESNCIIDYNTIKDCTSLIAAYNQGAQGTYEQALEVENRAKEIVASFPDELSELELEKIIYKYVKDNMYYDESPRDGSVYGYDGIMNGRGVCGDYAEMFALLANHAGLDAYCCNSDTHAWNIVKIDGVYYHCDALWDENVVEWAYFNKSTGYMYNQPDHMHDLRRYPICDVSMSVLEYCDSFEVE
ncbi:MAG: leucine-rich repeat domain-containing protein [Lachnospiraceae bacterium]|nr:leucine-rich repeat domain-containing protein [Lachnospiraceae bacterium]